MPQIQGSSSSSSGRIGAELGASAASTAFALGAGWGTTATIAITHVGSNDQAGVITVTSNGTGQAHIETVVSKIKRRYHLDVALHAPKIPYRETIRGAASAQGRHKKQTGGHGQFGDCWIRMEPLDRGVGFQFANETFGGSVPRNYIPAIEKGIVETAVITPAKRNLRLAFWFARKMSF